MDVKLCNLFPIELSCRIAFYYSLLIVLHCRNAEKNSKLQQRQTCTDMLSYLSKTQLLIQNSVITKRQLFQLFPSVFRLYTLSKSSILIFDVFMMIPLLL